MSKIYIQQAVLKQSEIYIDYIKEMMLSELKKKIDELKWEDIVSIEDRVNCNVYDLNKDYIYIGTESNIEMLNDRVELLYDVL